MLHARDPRRGQCVIACSLAAYRKGVRLGMSLTEAVSLHPHVTDPHVTDPHVTDPHVTTPRPQAMQRASEQLDPGSMPSDPEAAYLAPHDAQADSTALEQLAQWSEQFSPIVGLEGDGSFGGLSSMGGGADCLYLDTTHLAEHFGGEQCLARLVAQSFDQRGYHVRVALASTIGAAWALAHFATRQAQPVDALYANDPQHPQQQDHPPTHGSSFLVVPACHTFAALQALPVRALRLPNETASLLEQLGIVQIRQLARLPRPSLLSRFGAELVRRWDQALGDAEEVLITYRASPVFHADWTLEYPTHHRKALLSIVEELVRRVAQALAQRGEGVIELICRLHCGPSDAPREDRQKERDAPKTQAAEPGRPLVLRIGLFQPTASAGHLTQLVHMQLDQVLLPGPVEHVAVDASLTAPLERRQGELFSDSPRTASRQLAQLVDRLSSRLGRDAVVRPSLQADAQPERAYHYLPLAGSYRAKLRQRRRQVDRRQPLARPLHLRSPPLPLEVVAVAPDGPPIRLHLPQCRYDVSRHWGPERIETGWWRGAVCGGITIEWKPRVVIGSGSFVNSVMDIGICTGCLANSPRRRQDPPGGRALHPTTTAARSETARSSFFPHSLTAFAMIAHAHLEVPMCSYRELPLWQSAIKLAEVVYRDTRGFPRDEHLGLRAQIRHSALAIPLHVARHYTFRASTFLRGLKLARRSLLELECQVWLATRLQYWPTDRSAEIARRMVDVWRLLQAFFRSLQSGQVEEL